jgi:hypothetical protein
MESSSPSGMSEMLEARISAMFERRIVSSPFSVPPRSVTAPGVSFEITPSWISLSFVVTM